MGQTAIQFMANSNGQLLDIAVVLCGCALMVMIIRRSLKRRLRASGGLARN